MKKLTYLLVFIMFLGLSSCGGSEVCNCIDLSLEYTKEYKTANGDLVKIEKLDERFKEDGVKCMNLGKGKTDAERMEMDKEVEKCSSFKELMRLRSDDSKVDNGNNGQESEPTNSQPTELSDGEKKIKCLRMFGGGDMSAWETAQAECMLNNSQSACECMYILSK